MRQAANYEAYTPTNHELNLTPVYRRATIAIGILCAVEALGYGGFQFAMTVSDGIPRGGRLGVGAYMYYFGIVEGCLCILVQAPIGITSAVFAYKRRCGKRWMWITVLIFTIVVPCTVIAVRATIASTMISDRTGLYDGYSVALILGLAMFSVGCMIGFGAYFVFFFRKTTPLPLVSPTQPLLDEEYPMATPFSPHSDRHVVGEPRPSTDVHGSVLNRASLSSPSRYYQADGDIAAGPSAASGSLHLHGLSPAGSSATGILSRVNEKGPVDDKSGDEQDTEPSPPPYTEGG